MIPRWLRLLLCGSILVVGLALGWTAYLRSLIPQSIDGVVTSTRVVGGTTGRVTLVRVDERWIEADRAAVRKLQPGDVIHKDAWEVRLHVNGGDRILRGSPEVLQYAMLTPLAVAGVWLLTRRRLDESEVAP